MKNRINQVFIIILSVLLLISSILVTNTNYYYKYLQIAAYGIVIIYSIIRLIQREPIKIIKNKLDIYVICLVISTIIPVLFNKYVSLYNSVQTILLYIYMFSIYILVREITQDTKGLGKLLTNILIISAIVLIIIGIDGITLNTFHDFLESIKKASFENGDNRLIATFGYPNAIAVYIASILFLNINEYLKQDKKTVKAMYKTITFIFTVGIMLTYSKGIFLISPFAILSYIILIKDRRQKIEVIQNMLISFIMGIVYINAFEKFFSLYQDVLIWILFGVMTVANYIINVIVEFINTYTININLKKITAFFVAVIFICVVCVIIGLNSYDKYEVFEANTAANYKVKVINNIKR